MERQGRLKDRFPKLDIRELEKHVKRTGEEQSMGSEPERTPGDAWHQANHDLGKASDHGMSQHQERRPGVWRKPRQQDHSPPPLTDGSSDDDLVKPKHKGEVAEVAAGQSETEVEPGDKSAGPDSDETDASIFGLCNALHEIEDCSELSEASSQEDGQRALADKERVSRWRTVNLLLDDLDFAFVYTDFEEAYSDAGRAVAMAWSRARILAEPGVISDIAELRLRRSEAAVLMEAVKATAMKIRKVDERRKKKMAEGDTEEMVKSKYKTRFIEPLAHLMMDCKAVHWHTSVTEKELEDSVKDMVEQVVRAAETPTLYRAITTAEEVRKHLAGRAIHMGIDKIEPAALEEFLWQSHAQVRAVSAVDWLCKNLHLPWPLDKVDKPDTFLARRDNQKASSSTTKVGKQVPAVQPGMLKVLADVMVAGAEADDPTWLALLASWMQAMADLPLDQVLRKSVPVEAFGGWMLFFCKKGKQKHDRAGFYWGVPSETSGGYDWTTKFREAYSRRRHSDVGKEMMGMIFRTDTLQYLSAMAVRALTMNAVAGGVGQLQLQAAHSWRKWLPTIARYLKFSAPEYVAMGLKARAMGDEETIPRGYVEGKKGKSRICKLICAEVLSSLTKEGICTFDEVSEKRWEELAEEARAKVGSKQLDVATVWRNPDVAGSGGGFKVKKSQITFPKQLAGIPLAPSSRDGKRYCVDFQRGSCQGGDKCPLGLHKCAALYRGGRTCHGNHPGSECWNTKRHATLEEGNPREKPFEEHPAEKHSVKEHPVEELPTKEQPGEEHGEQLLEEPAKRDRTSASSQLDQGENAKPSTCGYVEDDSIMKKLLPKLREERYPRPGNRINPEPPRLVAKICEEEGRGELWLGPIPTEQRMDCILSTKPSIQICCFAKRPTDVQVEQGGEWGQWIPETVRFRFEMSNPQVRSRDFRKLRTCFINSLRQGDNAYVHCISGLSRAPMAATLLSARLMNISFTEALDNIRQTRNIHFDKGESRMQGPWMNIVLSEEVARTVAPTGFSQWTTTRVTAPEGQPSRASQHKMIHAIIVDEEIMKPICCWKKDTQWEALRRYGNAVASIEEAESQFGGKFGGKFCADCESMLQASLKIKVVRLFG